MRVIVSMETTLTKEWVCWKATPLTLKRGLRRICQSLHLCFFRDAVLMFLSSFDIRVNILGELGGWREESVCGCPVFYILNNFHFYDYFIGFYVEHFVFSF